MSNVRIPFGDNASDTATLLLGAAEDLEMEPWIVRTTSDGAFMAPREVAEKAGVDFESDDEESPEPEEKKPAKKTTAKKAAAKKASSK